MSNHYVYKICMDCLCHSIYSQAKDLKMLSNFDFIKVYKLSLKKKEKILAPWLSWYMKNRELFYIYCEIDYNLV